VNILELKRIALGHKYREEGDHGDSGGDGGGGYAGSGGEARAGMGFAGTGSGLSGTGVGAAQAGVGGGGGGGGAGYADYIDPVNLATLAQIAADTKAADDAQTAANAQAVADLEKTLASIDWGKIDFGKFANWGSWSLPTNWADSLQASIDKALTDAKAADTSPKIVGALPATAVVTPEVSTESSIDQTLVDAGLVASEPVALTTEAPVEKPVEQTLTDAGLVADIPANQIAALTPPKKAAGLNADQVNSILANTNYPESIKDFIKAIQPSPESTLGLLGINPGITYDQYNETRTPEQNDARLAKFGSLVDSAANMLISASPIGPAFNVAKIVGNVVSGNQTVGEALTQIGSAALASKLGISSSVFTKAINGDLGGAAQAFVTGKLSSSISKATGLPGALVSTVLKDADINKGTAGSTAVTSGFSKTLDGILGTGKEPLSQDKLRTLANFDSSQIAALNPDISEEEIPSELEPYRVNVTAGNQKESVGADFDTSKLPTGTELATQEDRDNGLASYDAASNSWVVNAASEDGLNENYSNEGRNTLAGGVSLTGETGQNTITDSSLPVNPNVGGVITDTKDTIDQVLTDAGLVTDGGYLDPVTIIGKPSIDDLDVERNPYDTQKTDSLIPLEEAKPLPDNTVKEVIADTPKDKTEQKIPIVVKPTPVTPTTPARQPTPSQAQRLADAFAVPTLANTFYGNADFSTKKVEVDDEGNIIEAPYEPLDVSKPAAKSLLANGGQITDNSTNHLIALLNHIMGSQDRNQLTEDDLLNIVRKGI
jgi:hypothetical protein